MSRAPGSGRRFAILAAASLALPACPTITVAPRDSNDAPPSAPIECAGTYEHGPSGLRFPEIVGAFHRAEIHWLDARGEGVCVGYNHEEIEASIAFTIFVWRPAASDDWSLEREFATQKDGIRSHHAGASEVASRAAEVRNAERSFPARIVEFRYDEAFNWMRQPVVSQLVLFERDGWLVKYRITHSVRQQASAGPIVADFLKVVPWGDSRGEALPPRGASR